MAFAIPEGINNASFAAALLAIKFNNERLSLLDKEEEDDSKIIANVQGLLATVTGIKEKSVWRFPTSNHWWLTVYPALPDELFVQHFRVDRQSFAWIVNEVKSAMTTVDTRFRSAVEIERKVAASMKCLATTCDMLTIAALFGIGRSSVHKYFLQFISAMYEKVVPKVIKFPSHDEIRTAAVEFEQLWGFPMAFAAIDGTHIPFNPPMHLSSDFYNYKGWRSIIGLAMCDARGKAIWLASGLPGRLSDSGAFKGTKCYSSLKSGALIPNDTRNIDGEAVPLMILGDSGFAMEPWLVKPFTHHGPISENQKIFNYRHSKARRSVENMFGRVKMRWRRLLRGLDLSYQNAHEVISVAFALNNICESEFINFDLTPDEITENAELEAMHPQPQSVSTAEVASGVSHRRVLMNFFCAQPNPWSGN